VLGLVEVFGNIEQQFPVDSTCNIYNERDFGEFLTELSKNKKTVLIGEPGSGKSWFISNFMDYLNSNNILFARHYCYTSLDDIFYTGRITSNIFMANLIKDIMTICPQLQCLKKSKYGVDEDELQSLLLQIDKECVIVIDGLDHIERICSSNESIVESSKTDVIRIIERLEVPENVKIVIVSQPVYEVMELCNKGYVLSEMRNWDEDTIERYLDVRGVEKYDNINGLSFINQIQVKSNGNPLYVTYLINELINSYTLSSWYETLTAIPDYNENLRGYYDYLMGRIEEDHKVVYALSGATFYLNIEELKSITHLGNYVEKRVRILRSILKESVVNGGFIIYHESFRRYILELLNQNGFSIYENIYKDLITWLKGTGVYCNVKAYINLFRILYDADRVDDLLEYVNIDFICESMYRGYGIDVIKRNADYLVKAATKKKSFSAMVALSEMSNIVSTVEFEYEIYEQKFSKCIGEIHGFKWLNNMLIYEGKANMSTSIGLRVCYSCSRNYVVPPWSLYINKMLEKNVETDKLAINEIKSI
jgi:nucleoside-triphosphatase THEP1